MLAWEEYKRNSACGTSIASQLVAGRDLEIRNNRHYLICVSQILLFCAHQEIALRGHRESYVSDNRGNFLELMHLLGKHDSVVMEKLKEGPRNAVYTSPEIQNTLLEIMGSKVRKQICDSVMSAGAFSLLADESKDVSKNEQMSVVVRYVEVSSGNIHERFLNFVQAISLTAEGLSTLLLKILEENKLDPKQIVSQGYDGATVMSGRCNGVQKRIQEVAPKARYVHCYAHNLNLALVDCVKNVNDASEFFALLQSLYVFISSSKAHTIFMEKQRELFPDKQPKQLQKLSDTRWACRYRAINAVCWTFDAVIETLQDIASSQDHVKGVEARGLLHQVQCFKFLLSLIIFDRVLSCTFSLSEQLQDSKVNLAKAADLVIATKDTLHEFRHDHSWQQLYDYATQVAQTKRIDISDENHRSRVRRLPSRLDDSFLLEASTSRQITTSADQYKIGLYYPILDSFIAEMERRFSTENIALMRAIQSCSPDSPTFLDYDAMLPLIQAYCLDVDTIEMETVLAKRALKDKDMTSLSDVIHEVYQLKAAFPSLLKLLQITQTIAVSTAECERSFSALKRIKTYLRSTMSNDRLSNLAILSIEKDLSKNICLEEVVEEFSRSGSGNRRIVLV